MQHKKKYESMLDIMPPYVTEYVRRKESEFLSPSTLFNYLKDLEHFFNWLIVEGYSNAETIQDIKMDVLEHLPLEDAMYYFDALSNEDIEVSKGETKTRKRSSVNRKKSALRSLFKFLTTQTENKETRDGKKKGEPYFYRNVMQKIPVNKVKESLGERARKIADSIFIENDDIYFLEYMKYEYEKGLSKVQLRYFLRDKERDYAILSLFLGSGIRLNELANLRIRDINFRKETIRVIRKGDKTDTVQVVPDSLIDLRDYLSIRNERYGASNADHEFVFVGKYHGTTTPLSVRTIQDLVKKYTKAFNDNVAMSPHKLRHTYATNLLETSNDITLVMEQLGHTSTTTTMLYVHSTQAKAKRAADAMSNRRKIIQNNDREM